MPGYDSWKTRSPDDDLGGEYEQPSPEQERADWEDRMQQMRTHTEKEPPQTSKRDEIVECPACRNWRDDCRLCDGTGEVTLQQFRDYGTEP